MTAAQKRLRELRERQSKERQRMAELGLADSLDDENARRTGPDRTRDAGPGKRQLRAAAVAVEDEDRASTIETANRAPDAEQRERIELRGRASVGRYLTAALRGPRTGRCRGGATAGGWSRRHSVRAMGPPPRATPVWPDRGPRYHAESPGTTGINLDVLRPYVFAPSVVDKLMVEMPHGGERHLCERHHQHGLDGGRGAEGWHRHDRRRAGNGRRIHGANHDPAPDRRQSQSGNRGYRQRWGNRTSSRCCASTSALAVSDELRRSNAEWRRRQR